MKPLEGLTIVSFESRHAKTLADLIRLQGAEAVSAPSMKEVPLSENRQVFEFGEKLLAGQADALIFLTGVGAKALVEILESKYPKEKILEAFRKTTILPRGPKPIRVLNEWKVPYALTVPEPNTWRELLAEMDKNWNQLSSPKSLVGDQRGFPPKESGNDKKPLHIFVQEYGVPNEQLIQGLKDRGALVSRVPVYKWTLPDDLAPLKNAIQMMIGGKVHAAVFTTAVQIEHVLQVAETMAVKISRSTENKESHRQALSKSDMLKPLYDAFKKMVIASVGPDCSEALRARGLEPDIEPESPKMGPLVMEIAKRAREILKSKL